MSEKTIPAPGSASNPLATEKLSKLITKFAIPAIISMLTNALYNIVDQIFIGQGMGVLGNAATNVAFPTTTLCGALALMIGIGTASNFNLRMGAGKRDEAAQILGTGIMMLAVAGVLLGSSVLAFLRPLMQAFGATEKVLPYSMTYTSITALGMPLLLFSTGCSHLIRSDGSPRYAMVCTISGAVLNTILDPIFIFTFNWGIAGAAWATVIGQLLTFILAVRYLMNYKSVNITKQLLMPKPFCIKAIFSLGIAAFLNHFVMMIVQITMNNTLRHYGALSQYGSEIPLACVGVIMKVNIIYMAFAVGISQGCQPVFGFNYGAQNYARVRDTYKYAAKAVVAISTIFFLAFQIFPRQIVSVFGEGSELYFHFAERYFRIYMMMVMISAIQPLTSNFFTSIGKAKYGIFISMTRQGLFLLPLIIIIPMFLGIDGVMYAGPIADASAVLLAVIFAGRELKKLTAMEAEKHDNTSNPCASPAT